MGQERVVDEQLYHIPLLQHVLTSGVMHETVTSIHCT